VIVAGAPVILLETAPRSLKDNIMLQKLFHISEILTLLCCFCRGKATAGLKCYDCQQTGHLAKDCPTVKKRREKDDPSTVRKTKELAQFHQERARLLADANSRLSAKVGLTLSCILACHVQRFKVLKILFLFVSGS
jgi:hypothetical protein